MSKKKIPIDHASAALCKLADFPYTLGRGHFIKILLNKNIPYNGKVIKILINYF